MSETIDYEAMRQELEANGYHVQSKSMTRVLRTIDDALTNSRSQYQAVFTTIESAYEHYLEQKRYAAMEAVLTELVQESDTYSLWLTGGKVEGITNLELDLEINVKLLQKAKSILGK